jgi:hypothetical protein
VVAFLRDLAPGPVAAGEIERLAVASGLLGKGKPLGQSKIFRTVRKSLGIKTYQKPGERAGGWIWSWPDQMIDLDRRVAKRHVLTEMAGVDQGHNKAAPYSQLIWDGSTRNGSRWSSGSCTRHTTSSWENGLTWGRGLALRGVRCRPSSRRPWATRPWLR